MIPDLKRLIDLLSKEKGIERESIIDALEVAVLTAARKKLGQDLDLEAQYNDDAGEVEVFQFKTVVDKVVNPALQISIDDARIELDEDAELGDSLGIKLDTSSFGRIAVQTAKQIIIQRVKDAERDNIYEEYKDRKGDLINGFVQRFEGGNIIVNLGRAEGVIPAAEQIHRGAFKRGERIRAYIYDVKRQTKGSQILLSRTHPYFVKTLFEIEVPEIAEGMIEIVSVAREPGNRSKIAVRSHDKDIDPVGACVGMRGSRVQSVVQELKGEKIDIVPFSDDPVAYVCSALSPAKVNTVLVDEENRIMDVIVPDDQLSLAIGKNGQNVRLAARLTSWKIDVKSQAKAEAEAEDIQSLMKIPGIDQETAELLYEKGLKSIVAIASAPPENLSTILEKSEDEVTALIDAANRFIENNTESKEIDEVS